MTPTLILTPNIGDLSHPARVEPHSPSSVGLPMPGRAAPVPRGSFSSYSPPKLFSFTGITTELPPRSLGAAQAQPPERLRVSTSPLDVAGAGFVSCPPPLALGCLPPGCPPPTPPGCPIPAGWSGNPVGLDGGTMRL